MKTKSAHALLAVAVCGAVLVAHDFLAAPAGPHPANPLFPSARLHEEADAWRARAQSRRAGAERVAGAYVRDRRHNHTAPDADVVGALYEMIDSGDLLSPELARWVPVSGPGARRTARRRRPSGRR